MDMELRFFDHHDTVSELVDIQECQEMYDAFLAFTELTKIELTTCILIAKTYPA